MKFLQAVAISIVLTSGIAQAQGPGKAMRHVNPLPNLMQVVKKHGDQLNLTQAQTGALADWRKLHGEPMHKMVGDIVAMEKALNEAAINGRPKAELMGMTARILNARSHVASTKVDCRDNMRRVLSAEQYAKVLEIYQGMVQ